MKNAKPNPAVPNWAGWGAPAALYALALGLRLIPAIFYPGINHPDEVFQSLEQAHRLVFGYGAVPWEFEYGARSWLLPGMLAGPPNQLPSSIGPWRFWRRGSCFAPFTGAATGSVSGAA